MDHRFMPEPDSGPTPAGGGDEIDPPAFTITIPEHAKRLMQSTVTISFACMTPALVEALYRELPGDPVWHDELMLLYTELTGREITD